MNILKLMVKINKDIRHSIAHGRASEAETCSSEGVRIINDSVVVLQQ